MMTTDLDRNHELMSVYESIDRWEASGEPRHGRDAMRKLTTELERHLRASALHEKPEAKAGEAGPSDEELRNLEQRASKTPDGWAATGSQRRRALYDAGYLAAQQSASVAGDSRVAKAYEMGVKDGKSRLAEWERKVVEAAKRWRDCAKFGISPVQADRELIEAVDALPPEHRPTSGEKGGG